MIYDGIIPKKALKNSFKNSKPISRKKLDFVITTIF